MAAEMDACLDERCSASRNPQGVRLCAPHVCSPGHHTQPQSFRAEASESHRRESQSTSLWIAAPKSMASHELANVASAPDSAEDGNKKKVKEPGPRPASFVELYQFASGFELFVLFLGCIGAIGSGVSQPVRSHAHAPRAAPPPSSLHVESTGARRRARARPPAPVADDARLDAEPVHQPGHE
jgi:hypothetical protein